MQLKAQPPDVHFPFLGDRTTSVVLCPDELDLVCFFFFLDLLSISLPKLRLLFQLNHFSLVVLFEIVVHSYFWPEPFVLFLLREIGLGYDLELARFTSGRLLHDVIVVFIGQYVPKLHNILLFLSTIQRITSFLKHNESMVVPTFYLNRLVFTVSNLDLQLIQMVVKCRERIVFEAKLTPLVLTHSIQHCFTAVVVIAKDDHVGLSQRNGFYLSYVPWDDEHVVTKGRSKPLLVMRVVVVFFVVFV